MNLSKPCTSLIPTLEGEVLNVLAGAEVSFSGLQVQRIIGKYTPRGVRNALQRLCLQGIMTRRPAGAADLYGLNSDHLMTRYIKALVSLRSEFLKLLEKEVSAWPILPVCGAIFGSTVRSEMKPESDIDIFIVRPEAVEFGLSAWRKQLTDLSSKVSEWTSNACWAFE
jgi:predicted nucleotidyltransferase